MINVEIDDQQLRQALKGLEAAGKDLRPALQDIGELLVQSTKQRFQTSTGPDGARWAPNTPTTLMRYLGRYKSSYSKKTGRLTKAGAERGSGKRPLIGETGSLMSQIAWQMEGSGAAIALRVGSPMVYAAAQQFGMKKGYAGTTSRGSPIPWGDIPARPFLGISDADSRSILDIIADHLAGSF